MKRNKKTRVLRDQISKLVEEYTDIALVPNPVVPRARIVPLRGS